jgi:hypothetical protein
MAPDIFVPVMMQPTLVQAQENLLGEQPALYHTWLRVFGRLRPGVNAAQAAAALDVPFLIWAGRHRSRLARATSPLRGKAATHHRGGGLRAGKHRATSELRSMLA